MDDQQGVSRPPQIYELPVDLIYCIADHASRASAACLAMCNRRLFHTLGYRQTLALQLAERAERISFLTCISRDLPQYYVCYYCIQMHNNASLFWVANLAAWTNLQCYFRSQAPQTGHGMMFYFQFEHVQQVMRRHLYGPMYGHPLESFQCTSVEVDTGDNRVDLTKLLTVNPGIEKNEFLLRSQWWIMAPREKSEMIPATLGLPNVCPHILSNRDGLLMRTIRTRLVELLKGHITADALRVMKCNRCYTEFAVHALLFSEAQKVAICITQWQNFGDGFDPEDDKWKGHLILSLSPGARTVNLNPAGTIRDTFEEAAPQKLPDPEAENIKKLVSRRVYQRGTLGTDGFAWTWLSGPARWYIKPPYPAKPAPLGGLSAMFEKVRCWLKHLAA